MRFHVRLGLIGLIFAVSGLFWVGQPLVEAARLAQPTGEERMDFGDAPDSTNHFGVAMTAYASGVQADYPTVFDPATGLPPGPSHIDPQPMFLGDAVSLEMEADDGPDQDPSNNIEPEPDRADLDRADDAFPRGLPELTELPACEPIELSVRVTVNTLVTDNAYLNLWFDWNQNGRWGDDIKCQEPDLPNNEWGVQNQVLTFPGPGVYNITTNAFLPAPNMAQKLEDGIWMRVTLSDTPATDADGRGPDNRWRYGETEDYLWGLVVVDPTRTPTPRVTDTPSDPTRTPTPRVTDTPSDPTRTPTPRVTDTPSDPTRTPTPRVTHTPSDPTKTPTPGEPNLRSDLGDAPDSTNHAGAPMTAYTGVPAQFPTVFQGPAPVGPLHHDTTLFHLGQKVSNEREADIGPDQDPTNNILPVADTPNRDRADDGLVAPLQVSDYPHCKLTDLKYTVQYNGATPMRVFFNAWADWDRSGRWGERHQCPGAIVEEWTVQNQVITLNPGLNTFSVPIVPWHNADGPRPFWLRLTVSERPALARDGSGLLNGWELGETEDYLIRGDNDPTPTPTEIVTVTPTPPQSDTLSDLGDAPDSTNHAGAVMDAYAGVLARFPTVFNGVAPAGPLHHNARLVHLGRRVSFEAEADIGPDMDVVNNIRPPGNLADQDRADDGLLSPTNVQGYQHCQPVKVTYAVTNNTGAVTRMYFNLWADWNRSGSWGETMECPNALVEEWAVQNQIITLNPGLNIISAPVFRAWNPASINKPFWMRMSLSDVQANNADGRGPAGGWKLGETEDYLIEFEQIDPSPTATTIPEPTATPTPTATPVDPQARADLGDAPDSTNHSGASMTAYTGVPARFPTVFGGPAPVGPLHQNARVYHLGRLVSLEVEADTGFDQDPLNNIDPAADSANRDRADDGLVSPRSLNAIKHCQPVLVRYTVTNNSPVPQQAFFNLWADWDRNGAWGGQHNCRATAVAIADEWAVQNQVITLAPGLNVFNAPAFLAYHSFDGPAALWFRMTLSDTPATNADGSGPANGWKLGETEDYVFVPDLGDAPDIYNHQRQLMRAYGFGWPYGRFPTVFDRQANQPPGPLHHNLGLRYVLGKDITSENEADRGPDADPTNNLVMNSTGANRDRADDAFGSTPPLLRDMRHCQPQRFNYNVTAPADIPAGTQAYVNVWIDWNRSGNWGGVRRCSLFPFFSTLSDEWAVKNQLVTLSGPGMHTFSTPVFFPYQVSNTRPAWLRITISDTPATSPTGHGPSTGWNWGETEDHLLRGRLVIGSISGTVRNVAGAPLAGAYVYLVSREDDPASLMPVLKREARTLTDQTGAYSFEDVPEGKYYVLTLKRGHLGAWYDDARGPATADLVMVQDAPVNGIDFDLAPYAALPVNIQSRGSTAYDHQTNRFFTNFEPGEFGPLQIRLMGYTGCLTCPLQLDQSARLAAIQGSELQLALRYPGETTNLATYPMNDVGAAEAEATIPQDDIAGFLQGGESTLHVMVLCACNGSPQAELLGVITTISASGFVTNQTTGAPIANAEVTLYHVPNWTPQASSDDDSLDSCESPASLDDGSTWSQTAPVEQGVIPNPHIDLFAPASAVQYTGADGSFAWNVEPGCWYVQVEAPGYAPKVSPVLGLSSAVSDLNIELLAADHQIFLPVVTK